MRRHTLSNDGVDALKPRAARYAYPDPELAGHFVRVTPNGAKSFVAVTRDPSGKQVWITIGSTQLFRIEEARDKAREAIKRIKAGLPAVVERAKTETFAQVAANYLRRHVEAKGLRSRREIERQLNVYILPEWREREFVSIRRGDIAKLLDCVEDKHGARQADYVLAIVRGIANWYAARTDEYVSPVARGMRRSSPGAGKRARIIDDDELRAIWRQAEASGKFGAILRLALLTAQRREKIATMKWADVNGSEWTVPREAREKGTGGALVLPRVAVEVIEAQPQFEGNPFVFAGRAGGPFNGFSPCKDAFDEKLPGMAPWVIHDLRRTARSLMARAGVRPDIAERVLGHAIAGVEGVYDRHHYSEEKAEALKRLAGLIEGILNPVSNVVPMPKREANERV